MQSRGKTATRPKTASVSKPSGIRCVFTGPFGKMSGHIEAAGRTGNFDVPLVIFVASTNAPVNIGPSRTKKIVFVMPEATVVDTMNCMRALGAASSNSSLVAGGFGDDYEGGAREVKRLAESVHVNETFWVLGMPVQKLSLGKLQGLDGATIQLS